MLSGVLNQHPREAMAWMDGKSKHDYAEFYKRVTEDAEG